MDVTEASRTARECTNHLFADEQITNLGLEEVVYDAESKQWRITFGFARPWDRQGDMGVRMSLKASRTYKVVLIDDGNSRVVGLTDRISAELTGSEETQETPHPVATTAVAGPGEVAEAASGGNGPADGDWDDVLQLIAKITDAASDGNYVVRGEAKHYPEVCSGLYRELRDAVKAGYPLEFFATADLNDAKHYTRKDDHWEILSHLQHYGGVTNLVDFTTDVNVALFFACDGHYLEDGRIIILERKPSETLKFHEPEDPADRAPAQRSVLVQPLSGVVEGWRKIIVPSQLKQRLMHYLSRFHDVNHRNVYSGYHGFIKFRQRHWDAFAQVDKGLKCFNKNKYSSAVKHLSAAIDHIEILNTFGAMDVTHGLATAYILRAQSYDALCKRSCAARDRDKFSDLAPATAERVREIFLRASA